jgi:hypothetical protein
MSEIQPTASKGGRGASAWVTAILAASAVLTVGYWSVKVLGEADTERMESPLMLSVARQLVVGPRELYGPFDGSNPLVLIHAPLYYRCAALLAWPMARAGLHPVKAARLSGRLISMAGLLATMGAAYRLGRMGGRSQRSGWWSALLVACSPVLASQPFAVRPDIAGVALQSWGVVLVLESLGGSGRRLGPASVLFGLSACVKQHLLGAWAVSTGMVAMARVRGRAGAGALSWIVLAGLAVVAVAYGVEWVLTAGRVWEATFVAAGNVGRIHPASWDQLFIVLLGMFEASIGLVTMLAASAMVAAGSRPGPVRGLLAGVGGIAIGLVLAALVLQTLREPVWTGVVIVFAGVAAAVIALPAAALSLRSSSAGTRIDATLWAYLLAELAVVTLLSRTSTGAWLNYGIPATVFASTLAGRALARSLEAKPPALAALPAILASMVMLASNFDGLTANERRMALERSSVELIDRYLGQPRSSYYFTDRPGLNRLDGRLELVHDGWLYPVFETLGLAEPRSMWLGTALVRGPIRVVVSTEPGPVIEGTTLDLRRLGYRLHGGVGPFFVWIR